LREPRQGLGIEPVPVRGHERLPRELDQDPFHARSHVRLPFLSHPPAHGGVGAHAPRWSGSATTGRVVLPSLAWGGEPWAFGLAGPTPALELHPPERGWSSSLPSSSAPPERRPRRRSPGLLAFQD